MTTQISVLIVGGSERDAALLVRHLKKGGFALDWERVDSVASMLEALRLHRWDVVLADYEPLGFTSAEALAVAEDYLSKVPFIVVSSTAGEDLAVEMMLAGARDYVMKDKLERLPPAVHREIEEAGVRRAQEQANKRLAAQQAATRLLAAHETLEGLLAELVFALGQSLGCDAGASWLVRADGSLKHQRAWFAGAGSTEAPKAELAEKARHQREVLWSTNPSLSLYDTHSLSLEGEVLSIAVPILFGGSVLAVLQLCGHGLEPPNEGLLATLRGIGAQVSEFVRRTRAVEALRSSEARQAAILESSLDAIVLIDGAGKIVDVNPAAAKLSCYSREEAKGQSFLELLIPARCHTEIAAERFIGKRIEVPIRRKDGTELAAEVAVVRLPPAGETLYTAFIRDITEYKRSEEIIQQTQRYLEEGQAIAHVGSWVSGVLDSAALWWSPEACRIFGVEQTEKISVERFFAMIHPDDQEAIRAASAAALWQGAPYDVAHRIVRPDGAVRNVRERAIVVRDENGTPVRMVGTVQDITEQTRIETRDRMLSQISAELTKVLAYPEIIESVAQLAVPMLADGAIVEVADELGVRWAVAHKRAEQKERLSERVAKEQTPPKEASHKAPPFLDDLPEGSLLWVPLRARDQELGHVALLVDGGSRRFDDFDRKTAEDFSFRAAFAIENARLFHEAQESIQARDEFLAIAGHELKTPITPLRMQVQSLLRSVEGGRPLSAQKLLERLSRVDHAAARLERLIETLLEVSTLTVGPMVLNRREADLAEIARAVVERLRPQLERAGSQISLKSEPALGSLDARRMEQACENLIENAAKYGSGKPIELEVMRDNRSIQLTVVDHGVGIALNEQKKLFQRFHRRAPLRHFGGFGLGLWIVRQIVEAHGGRVYMWSHPGEGARFTLELPGLSAKALNGP